MRYMKMLMVVLFVAGLMVSLALAGQRAGIQKHDRDRVCDPTVCPNCDFVDADGDGVCDNCDGTCVPKGADDDGDGIPNGQDDDYTPPKDGSGKA